MGVIHVPSKPPIHVPVNSIIRPPGFGAAGGGGGGAYTTTAVDFDGTNDLLNRAAELTGAADSPAGLLSFWFKMEGGDAAVQYFYRNDTGYIHVRRETNNTIQVRLINAAATVLLTMNTVGTFITTTGWTHFLASWNQVATPVNHLYIDDVSDQSVSVNVAGSVDYTRPTGPTIGASSSGGAQKLNGCLADFYFNMGSYLDLDIEANRRLFIKATGKPEDLGATGNTPTGSSPEVFMKGDSTDWQTNLGSGGAFTVTGALTDCADSPSD